jgi:DICT domain-containing protein
METAVQLKELIDVAANRVRVERDGKPGSERYKPSVIETIESVREIASSFSGTNKAANLFFTASVMGMRAISHLIEDKAITFSSENSEQGGNRFELYTAFQRLSRFLPQQERYWHILERGQPVYLFGVPDVKLHSAVSNLHIVELEEKDVLLDARSPNMTQFWIVALHMPGFVSMALVARELPILRLYPFTPTSIRKVENSLYNNNSYSYESKGKRKIERSFEGFWTYDQKVVVQIAFILKAYANNQRLQIGR